MRFREGIGTTMDSLRRVICRLLPLTALGLSACSLPSLFLGAPTIRDVRIERVELGWNTDVPATSYVGGSPRRRVVWITFSAERDLTAYGRDYSSSIWLQIGRCRDGALDPSRRLDASDIVTLPDQERLGYSNDVHPPRGDGRFPYLFSMALENRTSTRHHDNFLPHDFRTDAGETCFHFFGGPMWFGATHRSLDFRIPYAMIAEALARAGLPHAPER